MRENRVRVYRCTMERILRHKGIKKAHFGPLMGKSKAWFNVTFPVSNEYTDVSNKRVEQWAKVLGVTVEDVTEIPSNLARQNALPANATELGEVLDAIATRLDHINESLTMLIRVMMECWR